MFFYIMTETEQQFAEIIWDNEPLGSGQLVKLASEKLNWKKSTTYTVLRKLCENGIFKNENALIFLLKGDGKTVQSLLLH